MTRLPADPEQIRRIPFFAAAGEAATARLLQDAAPLRLTRGTTLFRPGEAATALHVVLEGSLGLYAQDEAGQSTCVELLGAGEVLLAPAVMLRMPYLLSARALTPARLLALPAETFRRQAQEEPDLARAVIELLSRHWRLMVDQAVDLKLRSAERRVARFLARRVREDGGAGAADLPEARQVIASRLGMTPETLSRALAALEARGAIRLSARRADVIDRVLLEGNAPQRRATPARSRVEPAQPTAF